MADESAPGPTSDRSAIDVDPPAALAAILGIERTVLGAPMARLAGGRLAAAVTRGGGLGFLGAGYGDPAWLAREVGAAQDTRVGIGLITWNVGLAEVTDALAQGPAALWLSFDDPRPLAAPVLDAGVPLVCQVASVAEAEQAADAGAAVIVAQGSESGGHGRSERSLGGLLPEIVAAVAPIPVVAAGGIVDRAGYDRALAKGAAGVALGTRLYATDEAVDIERAKLRLVEAGPDDTVRSVVYDLARGPEWPGDYRGRSLRSPFTDRWVGNEEQMRARLDEVRSIHERAVTEQDMSVRVVWAGEGVGGIDAIEPATRIVADFPLATGPGSGEPTKGLARSATDDGELMP